MRPFVFVILVSFFAIAHADCAEPSGDSNVSNSERGAVPALKRTWHSAVEGGAAVFRSTGKFFGSGVRAVTGLFKSGDSAAPAKESKQRLRLEGGYSPNPVFVKSTASIQVQLRIVNPTKRAQLLQFASAKRVDAVVRDASGQIVSRTSGGGVEGTQGSVVTVNPGERLEYHLTLPTAGMMPERVYTLEAAVTGQSGLLARMEINAK